MTAGEARVLITPCENQNYEQQRDDHGEEGKVGEEEAAEGCQAVANGRYWAITTNHRTDIQQEFSVKWRILVDEAGAEDDGTGH